MSLSNLVGCRKLCLLVLAVLVMASHGSAQVEELLQAQARGSLSTREAPLGNAVLSVVSGFPTKPPLVNPMAGHPYVLLRNSYANIVAKSGVIVPSGMSVYKYMGQACAMNLPDCKKVGDAINANAASAVRADTNGNGTFPGVPPGTYYLMISARYNNQSYVWGQAVQLKTGGNLVTLDYKNATPTN